MARHLRSLEDEYLSSCKSGQFLFPARMGPKKGQHEQAAGPTSPEGKGKEDRPGHTGHQVCICQLDLAPVQACLQNIVPDCMHACCCFVTGPSVCRFEMPFNVWCEGCGHLIGKGVRFNAEKQEIGKYHSTKIWSFTMTAPCCQQRIEVQTDPKNAQYNVVSGGRRKVA